MPSTALLSKPQTMAQAAQVLRRSLHPALRQLQVEENDDCLVIYGRVTTYYLKQLAQETLMPVRGDRQVVNRVNVVGR